MGNEIEIIKDRLNIVDVVGERVKLKKAGQHYKGLCPFHQEKTPSFIVSPSKGIWHCFGCQKGGDVISFVQEIEQIEFKEALQMLADRAGVELKKGSFDKQAKSRRQRIFDLLSLTAKFYHEILMNQAAGKKSRLYLKDRGVKKETMELFDIGYAPKSWDILQNFLRAKGFSPSEMVAAGVVGESGRGTLYDRFRGRIIFPVEDTQGQVVAFGGRIVPWHATGDEGKYINSPETEFYQKRRVIYNLHRAKAHLQHRQPCLVVEGYMDVVMSVQVGLENVVASSGTAFTEEALTQLGHFTDSIHFAFDADAAGMKAAIAATRAVLEAGMRVGLIILPNGSDPADLAHLSPEKLKKLMSQPRTLVSVLIEKLQQSKGRDTEEYLDELLSVVSQVANPVLVGEMVQEISQILHVPEAIIVDRLERNTAKELRRPVLAGRSEDEEGDGAEMIMTAEQQLLGLILAYPKVCQQVTKEIKQDYLLADDVKALYNVVHGLVKGDKGLARLSADDLMAKIPDENISLAEGLRRLSEERLNQSQGDAMLESQALARALKRRWLEKELKRLQEVMSAGAGEEKEKALHRFQELRQRLSEVSV